MSKVKLYNIKNIYSVNISNELKQMLKVKLYNIKNTYIGKEHKNVRKIGEFIIKLGTYFYQKTS